MFIGFFRICAPLFEGSFDANVFDQDSLIFQNATVTNGVSPADRYAFGCSISQSETRCTVGTNASRASSHSHTTRARQPADCS